MFVIRRIHDAELPANKAAIESVQRLLSERFPALRPQEIAELPKKLANPFLQRFTAVLYVAERPRLHRVDGFALVLREPQLEFSYLDYIASGAKTGGGVGVALYERVREDAKAQGSKGLFFECLPDEPEACPDATLRAENRARLKLYERWGARPIIGTEYEKPVNEGDQCMPHLVCDILGEPGALRRAHVKQVIRAVLERKYAYLCPPEYVEAVVHSVRADPVELRPMRYYPSSPKSAPKGPRGLQPGPAYPMVINDKHDIHHVHERGYVESPVRISSILKPLQEAGLFRQVTAKSHGMNEILAVHEREFVEYLKRACNSVPEGKSIYPYVFPIRNSARKPPGLFSVLSGSAQIASSWSRASAGSMATIGR